MTTPEAIYRTALEHIRDGSDAVCTECGLVGRRSSWSKASALVGPIVSSLPVVWRQNSQSGYAQRNRRLRPGARGEGGMMSIIKYPLSAFSVSVRFHPFCWGLRFHKHILEEWAKEQGNTLWFLRIGPFTVSQARML